ncbi:MAG: P-loop NTPase fold protein [Candidatus Altimarinota bacterium]
MSLQDEKPSNKDLLGIYGHVIALVYSLNSGFFNNSVIGLTGEWGNGKSTMMNLIKNLINEKYDKSYEVISINPWEYNDDIDFFDILLKNLFIGYTKIFVNFLKKKLEKIIKYVFFLIMLFLFVIMFGFDQKIKDLYQQISSFLISLGILGGIAFFLAQKDILKYLYGKTKIGFIFNHTQIGEEGKRFKELISERTQDGKKIIFLVDDLDRCSPKQVENILKTIVLFGNQENTIFVLGFDEKVITENLKKVLDLKDIGDDEKIKAYIEKIVHLQIPIPQIDKNDVSNYINSKLKKGVDFNIENINLSIDYLKEKKDFIENQLAEKKFKDDLFEMISLKTPRGINTGFRTIYYNWIYLSVLEYYGYFNGIDLEILLKTSVLKQLYGNIFNYLFSLKNFEDIFTTIFYILNYENILKNNLEKNELKILEKKYLYDSISIIKNILYNGNEINILEQKNNFEVKLRSIESEIENKKISLQELKYRLENPNLSKEKKDELRKKIKSSRSEIGRNTLKNQLVNTKISEDEKEGLLIQIRNLDIEINQLLDEKTYLNIFDENYKKLFDICYNLILERKKIKNIFPQNEKCKYFLNDILLGEYYKKSSLYNIFGNKEESQLETNLDIFLKYYNPPKLNDILLIKIINSIEKQNIFDFIQGVNLYLDIDKKEISSQKAICLLSNSIFVKNYKVDKMLISLESTNKILFGKLLNKLLDDIEYYFNLNKNINNNLEKMLTSFSKILGLQEIDNNSKKIKLFKIDLIKRYFRLILQLNLQYRIKEIGDVMILEKFDERLFKYYLSINIGKGRDYLKNYLIKNKSKLSDKKKEVLGIK